ncbi:glycosyl transferase family 1 [Dethiosulfatarculus sandiegensis]|uniref:Glycosyl transferase family 1 n=1 Tax=Dethiosulfatarculus sandiegensis TaxID=1429043 RepID=A0A0D2JNT6_9BACT|nr:glycosyl transferase family 1 [Dethiosulfatarculus sandiegensis]
MRVGIDICRLTDPWTGVGNYIYNLVSGLAKVDQANQYVLYPYFWDCFPKKYKGLAEFVPNSPNFRLHGADKVELGVKLFWCKLKLPKEPQLAKVDVTHSTNISGPRLRNSKLAVTIHDLSFVYEPQWHKKDNVAFSMRALNRAVRRADALIVPSEFTARELIRFDPSVRGRVRVVYEAVSPRFSAAQSKKALAGLRKKYGLEKPFFLFVGTLEPRKNLPHLVKVFHHLWENGLIEQDLVLVGGEGWKADETMRAIKDPAGRGKVKALGYVPFEDLPGLYQAAYGVVYPSLYEGFGLPVLEAMACGAPVITSNISSLPEVAGEAALLTDPVDESSLADAVVRLGRDQGLKNRMSGLSLEQAAKFSREAMGQGTLSVYRELAG